MVTVRLKMVVLAFAVVFGLTTWQRELAAQTTKREPAKPRPKTLDLELTTMRLDGDNLVSEYIQLRNPAAYQIRMEQEAGTFEPKELPLLEVIGDVYRWSVPLAQADIRLGGGRKLSPIEYRELYGETNVPVIVTAQPTRLLGEFTSYISPDAIVLGKPKAPLEKKVMSDRNLFTNKQAADIPIGIRVYLPVPIIPTTLTNSYSALVPNLESLAIHYFDMVFTDYQYLSVASASQPYTYAIEVPVIIQEEQYYTVTVTVPQEETYTVQVPYTEQVLETVQGENAETIARTVNITKFRAEERVRTRMVQQPETRTRIINRTETVTETREITVPMSNQPTRIMARVMTSSQELGFPVIASSADPTPSYGELFAPHLTWLRTEFPSVLSTLLANIGNSDLKINLSKVAEAFAFDDGLFLKSNAPNSKTWLRITYNNNNNSKTRLEESERDAEYIYLTLSGEKAQRLRLPIEGGTAELMSADWQPLVDVLRIDNDAFQLIERLATR